jgi:hypothetical protein
LPPSASSQVPILDEEWISKHQSIATSHLKEYTGFRYMEMWMTLLGPKPDIPQNDLLSAAEKSQIRTFGWPIGVVQIRERYRPKPKRMALLLK